MQTLIYNFNLYAEEQGLDKIKTLSFRKKIPAACQIRNVLDISYGKTGNEES